MALLIVACAFLVKKWSKFEPSTGELNPASAEISNSYRSAPETAFQLKAGRKATTTPESGPTATGVAGALPAGATETSAINVATSAACASRFHVRPVISRTRLTPPQALFQG